MHVPHRHARAEAAHTQTDRQTDRQTQTRARLSLALSCGLPLKTVKPRGAGRDQERAAREGGGEAVCAGGSGEGGYQVADADVAVPDRLELVDPCSTHARSPPLTLMLSLHALVA
eukprot:990773-Rhodomonas_salina.1